MLLLRISPQNRDIKQQSQSYKLVRDIPWMRLNINLEEGNNNYGTFNRYQMAPAALPCALTFARDVLELRQKKKVKMRTSLVFLGQQAHILGPVAAILEPFYPKPPRQIVTKATDVLTCFYLLHLFSSCRFVYYLLSLSPLLPERLPYRLISNRRFSFCFGGCLFVVFLISFCFACRQYPDIRLLSLFLYEDYFYARIIEQPLCAPFGHWESGANSTSDFSDYRQSYLGKYQKTYKRNKFGKYQANLATA